MSGKMVVFFVLILWMIPAAGADQLKVGIGDATAAPGSTVSVPVTIKGAQDLGSMDIAIAYDPGALSVKSVDPGSLAKGLFNSNTDRPGIITVSIADPAGIRGDGSVANLNFVVKGKEGSSSAITITNIWTYDVKTHMMMQAVTSDGSVTAKKSGPGSPGFGLPAVAGALVLIGVLRMFMKP